MKTFKTKEESQAQVCGEIRKWGGITIIFLSKLLIYDVTPFTGEAPQTCNLKYKHIEFNAKLPKRMFVMLENICRVSSQQIKSWSYTHGESSIPLLGATIGQLLEQAAEHHPDREAFIFSHQGIRMTSQQVLQQVSNIN